MEWIQIDLDRINPEGFHRYIQEITPRLFHIIEHDTDCFNGPRMYYGYSTHVCLEDYSEEKVLQDLRLCGYAKRQSPQIEAACIAYQSPELDIYAKSFDEIVNWKRRWGIVR